MMDNPDSDRKQAPVLEQDQKTIGSYVEKILDDLVGFLLRWLRTLFLVSFRPRLLAKYIDNSGIRDGKISRPLTFLLIGSTAAAMLIASFPAARETQIDQFIKQWRSMLGTMSIIAIIFKSLPLILVFSMVARLMRWLYAKDNRSFEFAWLYVFGLQGTVFVVLPLLYIFVDLHLSFYHHQGLEFWISILLWLAGVSLILSAFRTVFLVNSGRKPGFLNRSARFMVFTLVFAGTPYGLACSLAYAPELLNEPSTQSREDPTIRIMKIEKLQVSAKSIDEIAVQLIVHNPHTIPLVLREADFKLTLLIKEYVERKDKEEFAQQWESSFLTRARHGFGPLSRCLHGEEGYWTTEPLGYEFNSPILLILDPGEAKELSLSRNISSGSDLRV